MVEKFNLTNSVEKIKLENAVPGVLGISGDLEEAQMQFCIENTDQHVIRTLISKYRGDKYRKNVIISTILLILSEPELANLHFFDYDDIISSGNLDLIDELCAKSKNIFINVIYKYYVYEQKDNLEYLLMNAAVSPEICSDLDLCRFLFGLKRERVGVFKKKYDYFEIMKPFYNKAVFSFKTDYLTKEDKNKEHWVLTDYTGEKNKKYIPPFILQKIMESDFSSLEQIFRKLLTIPNYKTCFMELITNVISQDRNKMHFNPKNNASDQFVDNLLLISLQLSSGFFKEEFVPKIGVNKFPTFMFFNLMRLYGCSSKNINIDQYIRFIQKVGIYNEKLIFAKVDQKTENSQFIENQKKVDKLENLLYDFDFLYEFIHYIRKSPIVVLVENSDSFFCNLLFIKNTFLLDLLTIMSVYNLNFSSQVLERLIEISCAKSDDVFSIRVSVQILIKNRNIPITTSSLRMISLYVSDLEEVYYRTTKGMDEVKSIRREIVGKIEKFYGKLETNKHCEGEVDLESLNFDGLQHTMNINRQSLRFLSTASPAVMKEIFTRMKYNETQQLIAKNLVYLYNNRKPLLPEYLEIVNMMNDIVLNVEKAHDGSYMVQIQFSHILETQQNNLKLFLNKNVFNKISGVIDSILEKLIIRVEESKKKRNGLNLTSIANSLLTKFDSSQRENYDCSKFTYGDATVLNVMEKERNMFIKKDIHLVNLMEVVSGFEKQAKNLMINEQNLEKAVEILIERETLQEKGDKLFYQGREMTSIKRIIKILKENVEEEDYDDAPDDLLDPLTGVLMKIPVIITTSNQTIDLSTFKQLMLNDQKDPFNRMNLTDNSYKINEDLQKRVNKYLKGKE
ncbi:hypothetical protein NUSPORA_01062 [Nucleospora cyclopteri]